MPTTALVGPTWAAHAHADSHVPTLGDPAFTHFTSTLPPADEPAALTQYSSAAPSPSTSAAPIVSPGWPQKLVLMVLAVARPVPVERLTLVVPGVVDPAV